MSSGSVTAGVRDDLRSTLKHGAIYGLGTLLAKAIGFIMIPIYTRVLTPEDYGVLELLTMTTDVIALVAGLGLTWAVTRYYYYYDDPDDRRRVVSSAAVLFVALFGLASAAAVPFAEPLSLLVLGRGGHADLVRLAILSFFLLSFLEIPLAFLRARQASVQVVGLGLARLVLALALNIWFVVILRWGVAGVLYSTILASAAAGAYLTAVTLREAGLRFSAPIARKLLAYGFPVVAANLGSFVLHYSDRYFLRAYDSLATVGLYSLSYKFAMLMSLFIATPFALIWAPKAFEVEKREGERARPILRRILSYYNVALVSAGLGISLFAGDVIRVMASAEFHAADRTIPLLCLGMLFFGYRQVSYVGAAIRERTDVIGLGTAVAAGMALVANFLLIPRWGAIGAAVATALAFALEFAIVMSASERIYRLGYPIPHLFAPVLLAVAAYLGTRLLLPPDAPLSVSIATKALAFALFAAALVLRGDLPRPRRWPGALAPWRIPSTRDARRHR